jgi:hypothetical protein
MFIEGFIEREKLADRKVTIVTDPSLKAFQAADLERSLMSTVGPKAIRAAMRARKAGFRQVAVEGDKLQQGGIILIDKEGRLGFHFANPSLGVHADPDEIVKAARALG